MPNSSLRTQSAWMLVNELRVPSMYHQRQVASYHLRTMDAQETLIPSTDGWNPNGFPYFTAEDSLHAIAPPLPAKIKSRLIPCSISVQLHPVLFVCDSMERRSLWVQSSLGERIQAVGSTSEAFLSYSKAGSVDVSVIIFDVTSCRMPISAIFSVLRQDYPNIPVILIGRNEMDGIKTENFPEYGLGQKQPT